MTHRILPALGLLLGLAPATATATTVENIINDGREAGGGVPNYDQSDFPGANDCGPVAAAMVLGYWDANGWTCMIDGSPYYTQESAYSYTPAPGINDLVQLLQDELPYNETLGTFDIYDFLIDGYGGDLDDVVTARDSGADWSYDTDLWVDQATITDQIDQGNPMLLLIAGTVDSTDWTQNGPDGSAYTEDIDMHWMAVIGYRSVETRWQDDYYLVARTGWAQGTDHTVWYNWDSWDLSDWTTVELEPGGTPGCTDPNQPLHWKVSYGGTSTWSYVNTSSVAFSELAVGDLDGDGADDIFTATGSTWQVSYNATSSWDQLASSAYDLDDFVLADVTGDGRDDVFLPSGWAWYTSSAATSSWSMLARSSATLDDILLGDLNGDGRDDVFYPDGSRWYASYGGNSSWSALASSSSGVEDVLLGDMDGDGADDVFTVSGGRFKYSRSGASSWTNLASSSVSISDLLLADFNGDGIDDVFYADGSRWLVSYSGTSSWQTLNWSSATVDDIVVGDFDGNGEADVFTAYFR